MTALMAATTDGADGPVLTLNGEANITNVNRLRDMLAGLIGTGATHLTIDAAGLVFLDATALRTLLRAARTLRGKRGSLTIRRPRQAVATILAITGADQLLDVQTG
jgi:anti-anti-sigma factor